MSRLLLLLTLAACGSAPIVPPPSIRTLTGPDSIVYVPFHRNCLPLRPVRVDSIRTQTGTIPGPFVGLMCARPLTADSLRWHEAPGKVGGNG